MSSAFSLQNRYFKPGTIEKYYLTFFIHPNPNLNLIHRPPYHSAPKVLGNYFHPEFLENCNPPSFKPRN